MSYAEQPRKSNGLKILLWVVVILVVLAILACVGCFVGVSILARSMVFTDPVKIQSTAESISAITPPPGYDPTFATDVMGMVSMVIYGDMKADGDHMLMLMSFPVGVNQQEMRSKMKNNLEQQGQGKNINVSESTGETFQVRGEETVVTIDKGSDSSGKELRQIYFTFTSKKGGPAMFMMVMPEEEWSDGGQQAFKETLASME